MALSCGTILGPSGPGAIVNSPDWLVSYQFTPWGGALTLLQRCSRYILQPQPTRQPYIGPYQVLPLQSKVDLGAMAIKVGSFMTFQTFSGHLTTKEVILISSKQFSFSESPVFFTQLNVKQLISNNSL